MKEKLHYIEKNLTGLVWYYKTRVTNVQITEDEKHVIVTCLVNPTKDNYTTERFVQIETTVTVKSGKMKSKSIDAKKRSHIAPAKRDAEELIEAALNNNDIATGDASEAKSLTINYYRELMIENGIDANEAAGLEIAIRQGELTVTEAEARYNELLASRAAEEPEAFHIGKHVCDTYTEAVNVAYKFGVSTTLIVSSRHATMTPERVQELESMYMHNLASMVLEDAQEYYNYCDENTFASKDHDERKCKLKSHIERRLEAEKEKQRRHDEDYAYMKDTWELTQEMKSLGLEVIESTMDYKYYMNGEQIGRYVTDSHGRIDVKQMNVVVRDIYNKHFATVV